LSYGLSLRSKNVSEMIFILKLISAGFFDLYLEGEAIYTNQIFRLYLTAHGVCVNFKNGIICTLVEKPKFNKNIRLNSSVSVYSYLIYINFYELLYINFMAKIADPERDYPDSDRHYPDQKLENKTEST